MITYQVTGYRMIPVWTEVDAGTTEDALDKCREVIENVQVTEQEEQWLSENYYVTSNNGETNELQMVDGEILRD
jgi:hypothetical protein